MSTSTFPLSQNPPAPVQKRSSVLLRALFGLATVLIMAIGGAFLLHASIDPTEDTAIASTRHESLAGLSTWSDRSSAANVADLATTSFDLVVIDPAPNGHADLAAIAARVKTLRFKSDNERRLVLAPLSIAEAEENRPYWNSRWASPKLTTVVRRLGDQSTHTLPRADADPRIVTSSLLPTPQPSWLADQSNDRAGSWRVRYWMPEWQSILFGNDNAMLDRMIAAGFDGIVLDRADVHAHWSKQHPEARTDMIALIETISRYAREKSPGFLVVLKDAEDLLDTTRIRSSVDAVIKQDLLFGRDGLARGVNDRDMASSIAHLKRAQRDGLLVLVAEYPANESSSAAAGDRLLAHGFVGSFGQRNDRR